MKPQRCEHLNIFEFKNFDLETLTLESRVLKGNPLKDSPIRRNPVLVPKKATKKELPVVFVLAGFTGNGPKYFSIKTFEDNMPEVIDRCVTKGNAPLALYVFVDAMTFWGGSQFINSEGTGRYEDYILRELVPAVKSEYPVSSKPQHWCVTGGSSGGYGALHLASSYPETFALSAALAPDSAFEMSLLPDIYASISSIESMGGILGVKKELKAQRLMKKRGAHSVLNAIGMGLCYSPSHKKGGVEFPVDFETGELIPRVWARWLRHDPVRFLLRRDVALRKLRRVFLRVGSRDQYHLHFGSRRIRNILKQMRVPLDYSEFDGNHFDIGDERPQVWAWLKKQWKNY